MCPSGPSNGRTCAVLEMLGVTTDDSIGSFGTLPLPACLESLPKEVLLDEQYLPGWSELTGVSELLIDANRSRTDSDAESHSGQTGVGRSAEHCTRT